MRKQDLLLLLNMTNSTAKKCLAGLILATLAASAQATPDRGANCASCHNDQFKNGMAVLNFQILTNLGSGLHKVFQVRPGHTNTIQFSVTNGYGGNYSVTINNLNGNGYYTATHHLSYIADNTWAARGSGSGAYFTIGPVSSSPTTWNFNLAVQTNAPIDFYSIESQMAGLDSGSFLWAQTEPFYVQVIAASAPQPLITNPHLSGNSMSVQVASVSGFTYYLEYRTNLTIGTWLPIAQTAGNGGVLTLTDAGATDQQRFYRVRVQ